MRTYIAHNDVLKYWKIRINSTLPDDSSNLVFKGKTIDNAIKAAQKYCDNNPLKYKTLTVGEVLYECDYWGRRVVCRTN